MDFGEKKRVNYNEEKEKEAASSSYTVKDAVPLPEKLGKLWFRPTHPLRRLAQGFKGTHAQMFFRRQRCRSLQPVSYTHLTLPTNAEV